MIRVSPVFRLSIGLVILVVSILILAQALGLSPNSDKQNIEIRTQFSETLAAQVALAIQHGDEALLRDILESSLSRNLDMQSAGVRLIEGKIIAATADHEQHWLGADIKNSTPTHLRYPIIMAGIKRANFEISFLPLRSENHPIFHIPTFMVLIIFVSISGFFGFWLYLKRLLHYLDPSAVVPARVRNALNILAEGVLILDKREHIVLANAMILEKLNRTENSLIGKKASMLGWQLCDNQEAQEFPWHIAINSGEKQIGIRISLPDTHKKNKIFSVNAVPILDPKGTTQGTIAVFDDISELEEKSVLLEKMVNELAQSRIAIETKNKELLLLAMRDPMTNCLNRRALHEFLNDKFAGALNTKNELCCIMADIDHFKKVNDSYGHGIGDDVIKMVANTIKEIVREFDLVARMGGEEFCIILPRAPLEVAVKIAERCREKIAATTLNGIKVTASFGVTSIKYNAKTSDELINQADEALYASKKNGRNRVTEWSADIQAKNAATN